MEYKDYKQRLDKALKNKDIDQEKYDHLMEWVEIFKK
jgi:hypothetical protein